MINQIHLKAKEWFSDVYKPDLAIKWPDCYTKDYAIQLAKDKARQVFLDSVLELLPRKVVKEDLIFCGS